jgi:hypothetical protein
MVFPSNNLCPNQAILTWRVYGLFHFILFHCIVKVFNLSPIEGQDPGPCPTSLTHFATTVKSPNFRQSEMFGISLVYYNIYIRSRDAFHQQKCILDPLKVTDQSNETADVPSFIKYDNITMFILRLTLLFWTNELFEGVEPKFYVVQYFRHHYSGS